MNENRRQILEMLAAGKITADEAERLLAALEPASTTAGPDYGSTGSNGAKAAPTGTRAKYLRVLVEANQSLTGNEGADDGECACADAIAARGRAAGEFDSAAGARSTGPGTESAWCTADALADQAREPGRTD